MASRRLETSELVFKIVAYTFLIVFSLFCLYPLVYAVSAAISGRAAFFRGEVVLLPVDIQFDAFKEVFTGKEFGKGFWISYASTLFVTFYGTIWALVTSIMGAYALSKKRLKLRSPLNFFFVFTMWFTAGMVPQLRNYTKTQDVLNSIGIQDTKWLIVLAMGMAAFNVILLRNAFEGVSKEIEEAATVDGATEFQLLWKVYVPMSKATIATVALLFGISRWNGYFWARAVLPASRSFEWPLQVYIRDTLSRFQKGDDSDVLTGNFGENSLVYAMIVCAILPILIIYPYIQKYFAKGVNMGGVKE